MKNIAVLSFLILCLFLGYSCKRFVEIPEARNQIISSTVFSDSADAIAAISGIYTNIMSFAVTPNMLNGSITIYTGLSSDELYSTTGASIDNQFYSNLISSTNNNANSLFWQFSYQIVYQANACIEGLSASSGISISLRNQLIGEAHVIRAFCYFNLINLYGPVPLVLNTAYRDNSLVPRTSTDSVYNQIISDLLSAQSLLLISYPSVGKVRPNQFAATSLLAKAYLYHHAWTKAEAASTQVINSGLYSLLPDLTKVFLAGSSEAIWQMIPLQAGYETAEGFAFIPGSNTTRPKYVINTPLLNAFESGDQRKVNWLNSNTINNTQYFYPNKYKLGKDNNTTPKENYTITRLAEQYLIRAEALAQQGNIQQAKADLNMIRHRAGLTDNSDSTQNGLLTSIYHERQIELLCEWGNRWFDLKRTGMVNGVMGNLTTVKGNTWNSNAQLYPLPVSQLQLNPFLVQNEGY